MDAKLKIALIAGAGLFALTACSAPATRDVVATATTPAVERVAVRSGRPVSGWIRRLTAGDAP